MRFARLVFLLLILAGCASKDSGNTDDKRPGTGSVPAVPPVTIPAFDGERAFGFLLKQTSFGPRNPNSNGHRKCLIYLVNELRTLADRVTVQEFTHNGYGGEKLELANIVASFNLEMKERILLCAHWDTRPRAEHDEDKSRRNEPILGANDGASGVAVLLEIATLMKHTRPRIGVDIVLFDGEDYGKEGDYANYLLGSRHYALNIHPDSLQRLGILLDMVGDTFLDIGKEGNSMRFAPDIVEMVWSKARELGYTEFVNKITPPVYDDHLPLNEIGVKTINLIDFNYPDQTNRYWHTHQDIPERCSPRSLEAVGTVVTHVVYSQRP